LNFVGHLESAEANAARSLLEKIGAWKSFGQSGCGKHGDEAALFVSVDKLSDGTANDISVSLYLSKVEAHYSLH
jgi:hypothetical protein